MVELYDYPSGTITNIDIPKNTLCLSRSSGGVIRKPWSLLPILVSKATSRGRRITHSAGGHENPGG
jgi:hypothetical protein